jgi:hypothetical protein
MTKKFSLRTDVPEDSFYTLELENSEPTRRLTIEAYPDAGLVMLVSHGKRGGIIDIERLTKKEAYDLVTILRYAARQLCKNRRQAEATA